jgi:hypothetical protein
MFKKTRDLTKRIGKFSQRDVKKEKTKIIIALIALILYITFVTILCFGYTPASSQSFKGSTFIINYYKGYTYFITNDHVCRIRGNLSEYDNKQTFLKQNIEYIHSNAEHDLCIFRVKGYYGKPYKITLSKPIKEKYYKVNCTYHNKTYSLKFLTFSHCTFEFDGAVAFGCSGSPVLDDKNNVIGIMFAVSTSADKSYAIPSYFLYKFLKGEI